jgi:acyl-CoA synthetase (AMP-forming)/AMP-acid ligase II
VEAFEARRRRARALAAALQAVSSWRIQRARPPLQVIVGGAALEPELKRFWESMGYLVLQGYGLTETAPIVMITDPFDRGKGVGHPVGAQEVKIGPQGEVLVRGPKVALGYRGRPVKSSSKASGSDA